jgi:hypothetical protein
VVVQIIFQAYVQEVTRDSLGPDNRRVHVQRRSYNNLGEYMTKIQLFSLALTL